MTPFHADDDSDDDAAQIVHNDSFVEFTIISHLQSCQKKTRQMKEVKINYHFILI